MAEENVTITRLRSHLSSFLNRVKFAEERIPIFRRGKIIAVLMPVWDYQRILELEGKSETYKRSQMDAKWGRWQHVKRMTRDADQS